MELLPALQARQQAAGNEGMGQAQAIGRADRHHRQGAYEALRTDEWSRGIGVPHLSSYLNGRLWLDAEEIDEAPATVTGISDDGGEREEWT